MRNFDFIKRHRRFTMATLEREFARARAEVPALAPYETTADAVRTLRNTANGEQRAELTEVLLGEIRNGRTALSSLLLHGFLPMLEYVLVFGQGLVDDDDLRESMILEAFSEAVAGHRGLHPKPCLYLHRETQRHYRKAARKFSRERNRVDLVGLKALDVHQEGWWESKPEGSTAARGIRVGLVEAGPELATLLRSLVGGRMAAQRLELIEATVLQGEDLAAYVDRTFPGLAGDERDRAYSRLQRQRHRTVSALRRLLAPWRKEVLEELPLPAAPQVATAPPMPVASHSTVTIGTPVTSPPSVHTATPASSAGAPERTCR